jgi:hypothetical protein
VPRAAHQRVRRKNKMSNDTTKIDTQKCKFYFKFLLATFLGFAIPILLLITRVIPVGEGGNLSHTAKFVTLVMVFSALLYYVFLGILATKNNKSVVVWVGLSVLTSPIGPFFSFFLMLSVGKKNGWV